MTTLTVNERLIAPPRSAERRFYLGMSLMFLATVLLGFARTFFLRPLFRDFAAIHGAPESFFYVHGAIFLAWILFLIAQTTLISTRRVELHRRLGWGGAALAATMVAVGFYGALLAARRPTGFIDIPLSARAFLAVPLFDMIVFGSLVAVAVVRRRDTQTHKRLMLIGTISILTAAIARWPMMADAGPPGFLLVTDLLLVPIAVWDWRQRRRLHPATIWGGLALIVSQPLRMMISGTAAWDRIAAWLIGSP